MSRTTKLLLVGAAAALLGAPSAAAHVSIKASTLRAGSFAGFAIHVPNERDRASTVKVTVRMPAGLAFVTVPPKEGWRVAVATERLDRPIVVCGERVTERVTSVTWSRGVIRPGQSGEFAVSAKLPDNAGRQLVFPAVQTYSNGEVVRWLGPTGGDQPAPRLRIGS
jgi:uncharacterized protein YcnI